MDKNLKEEVVIIKDDDDNIEDIPHLTIPKRLNDSTIDKVIVINDDDVITHDIPKRIMSKSEKYNDDKGKVLTIKNEYNFINEIVPDLIRAKIPKYRNVDTGLVRVINNNTIDDISDLIQPKKRKYNNTDKGKLIANNNSDNTKDDKPKMIIPKRQKYKNRDKGKRKRKRQVKVDISGNNTETLIITQNVAVKKQKLQCIINLTNICDHKVKFESKGKTKNVDHKDRRSSSCKRVESKDFLKTSVQERIVPHCSRKCCQSAILSKCSKLKQSRRGNKMKETKKASKVNVCSKNSTFLINDLSSISLSDDNSISYDSISSDSFCSFDYKVKDLDTLIKRTKDREKKMRTACDEPPLNASSSSTTLCSKEIVNPANSENSTNETDVSIHSLVTLKLEPQPDNGSPTNFTESPIMSPEKFADIKADSDKTSPANKFRCRASTYPIFRPNHKLYSSRMSSNLIYLQVDHDTQYKPPKTVCSENNKGYSYSLTMSFPNLPVTVKSEKTEDYCPILNPDLVHTPYSPTMNPNCFYPECGPTKPAKTVSSVNHKSYSCSPTISFSNLPITVKSEKTEDYCPILNPELVNTRYSATMSPKCFYPECDPKKLAKTVSSVKNRAYYSDSPTISFSNLPITVKSEKTEDYCPIMNPELVHTPYSPTMSPNCFYPECNPTKLAKTDCSKKIKGPAMSILSTVVKSENTEEYLSHS